MTLAVPTPGTPVSSGAWGAVLTELYNDLLTGDFSMAGALTVGTNLTVGSQVVIGGNSLTGAWTAYTPVWTTIGTAPVLGNGSLTGFYMRVGKLIHCRIHLLGGSTTTYGNNSWRFTVPVTAAATDQVGSCRVLDAGSANRGEGCFLVDTTHVVPISNAGDFTNLIPQTWAVGDRCDIQMTYEAA